MGSCYNRSSGCIYCHRRYSVFTNKSKYNIFRSWNLGSCLDLTVLLGEKGWKMSVSANFLHCERDFILIIWLIIIWFMQQPLPWASGLPVAIKCAWNLDPSLPSNATGEIVCSQCTSSGFPVVFQCVPIMQINTGSPLEHHRVLSSASVVPVASQYTCGSTGLPVCSNYAN